MNLYGFTGNDPVNWVDPEGKFKGNPKEDFPTMLKCTKGLLRCANNIEELNKECQKECGEGGHGGSMYKCAIDKCWEDFQDCLKFSLPGG